MKNTAADKKRVSLFFVSNNEDSHLFGILESVNKMYENAEDYRLKVQLDSVATSLNAALNKLTKIRNRYDL